MRRKRKARELLGNVVELGYTTARQDIKRRQLYNANVNAVTTDQSSIVAHVENDRSPIKTNSFCSVSHLEQPWQPTTPDKRERCSIILVSSEHYLTSHGHSTGTSKIQNISLQRMQKGTTIMPHGDGQIRLSPRPVLGPARTGQEKSWPDEAWVRSSPAQQGLLQLKNQFKDWFKTKNRDVNESEAGSSCIPNEIVEHVEANHFEPQGASSLYIDLGDCDQICEHCKATFWYEERLTLCSKDRQVRYHRCCRGGRVVLPMEPEPPDYIKDLFKNKHFLDNIRAYNQMFSMTSFGARVDESVNAAGTGPYVFKISGQIFHWIGTLCPREGDPPRFLQLYIYDTENEVSNRMHHFGGQDNSGNLRPEVVEGLISFLNEHNGLVRLFRTARDKCNENYVPEFRIRLYNGREDELPISQILGAIVFESGPKTQTDYDVIIEVKDGRPKRINKLHPSYMSLQFPLIFIYGQSGYHGSMKLINSHGSESEKIRRLTMNMYYAHQLHDRFNLYGLLARGGRLFQQYVVGAYCSIELNRMDYIRCKQQDIRNEYLSGLYDAITRGDHDGSDVGTRTILPASFTGGPRYMYSHYLDALAICRVHGNPKFFITFTCNVKWPEIKRYMSKYPELSPADRADIVDRIFQMKVRAFISLLKNEKPFGHVTAVLYTIEFQNRGLPHCHTLLWVKPNTKILAGEDVDQYITAELPDPKLDPHGYKVVSEMMMHGPCGSANSGAACMQEGVCSKSFPKVYNEKTFFDKDGYVHYQRRNTGIYSTKRQVKLDNSYVVPYNRFLCFAFRAHINVEYCGWNMLIKYLFKFISKGTDRVVSHITRPVGDPSPSTSQRKIEAVDEIQNFVNARYIGPYEACWRIFNFDIHHREPAVVIMAVHLENMQQINFRSEQRLEAIVGDSERKKTTLTEWLNFNTSSEEGRHLTYLNFPSEFVWYVAQKSWKKRANKNKPTIGRLTYVHPSSGELFYLRMLLCHRKGCKSFQDIRRVDDKIYPTYRAACKTLGLLGDDKEWSTALKEAAAHSGTSAELRSLFAHILIFSEVTDPITLWKKHWTQMAEDIPRRISASLYIDKSHVELEGYVLYQMEVLLNSCAKSLKDFGLPLPPRHLLDELTNKLLVEERNYDRDILTGERYAFVSKLDKEQKEIYDLIINASTNNLQELIFVHGHGGTGKTFLWKSIISSLRSEGKVVLAVASSGIASLLLPSGQTAHSRFKLPLNLTDESMCRIKKGSHNAELLAQTDVIIWDEAPMNDRRCFETLDRSLRDILDAPNIFFGGKSVMLGGDFRQTLPVKKGASKIRIIDASVARSELWSHFRICTLKKNMRLLQTELKEEDEKSIVTFSSWLLDVGDGKIGEPAQLDPHNTSWIKIPDTYCIPDDDDNGISELIRFIYDEEMLQQPTAQQLQQKVIVCPKNETADLINLKVLSMVKGSSTTYVSSDEATPFGNDGGETEMLYPVEYLNALNFPGLPPHQLELKIGAPIMLLRNLNLVGGLCNGTRMIITQLLSTVIEAQIITGTRVGEKVFIPRINVINNDRNLPFIFKRKQFPVKGCYAMTINKSQGQSLNKIGIYLPEPVFGHGQLYVALSRATSPSGLKVLIKQQEGQLQNATKNIVYKDFLTNIDNVQDGNSERR